MFEDYYKLNGRPFQLTPDPKYYFQPESHSQVIEYFSRAAIDPDGVALVTGDIGTGKTTLARYLQEALDSTRFVVGMMSNTRVAGTDLMVTILNAFGLEGPAESMDAFIGILGDFAAKTSAADRQPVLIVDEAQSLSNTALEDLCSALNLGSEHQQMHCLLIAQPGLKKRISANEVPKELTQCMTNDWQIQPLTAPESAGYLLHRLKLVGWNDRPVFSEGAMKALHQHSDGIPRQLNTLCARVLLFGALDEMEEIDQEVVDTVASELEEETKLNASHRERISSLANSGVSAASMGDTTIPLELSGRKVEKSETVVPEAKEMEGRLDKIEDMMKSQDATLKQLTSLMTQLANQK